MNDFKNQYKQAYFLLLPLLCFSYTAFAEPFTVDCGHNKTYKEIRLIVDLDSKSIKKAWLLGGLPSKLTEYIIYEITDDEVRANRESKIFGEIVSSEYLVLNRYNLHLFMASGEDWNNPARDGNIKGSGAECKKVEKAF